MKILTAIIPLAILCISCDPIGDTISENKEMNMELVNSIDEIKLKKGDVLVLWGVASTRSDIMPSYNIKYFLSKDDKVVSEGKTSMFDNDEGKIINSTYQVEKEEVESTEESTETSSFDQYSDNSESSESSEKVEEKPKKEIKKNIDWAFEKEIIQIPITEDGTYSLDYKVKAVGDDTFFDRIGLILRKK